MTLARRLAPELRVHVCLASVLLCMQLVSACTGEAGAVGPEDEDDRDPYIVGGKISDSFSATGSLTYQGQHFCTATLTAPNKVLTAAHCMDAPISQYITQVEFILGVDRLNSKVRAKAASFVRHPQYDNKNFTHDIAVVTLSTPINQVKPVVVLHSDPSGLKGQTMVLVGYGRSGNDATQGIRREVEVTLSDVLSYKISYPWKGQGSCYGDSGGPAFISTGGKWQQVGITSHGTLGTPNCQEKAYYTRIDTHKAFILAHGLGGADRKVDCGKNGSCDGACRQDQDCKYLNGNGPPPGGGGAPPGGGGAPPGGGGAPPGGGGAPPGGTGNYGAYCTQNNQCKSGLCSSDPNGGASFCTQSCNSSYSCPSGHQCYATQYPNLNICAPATNYQPPTQKTFGAQCNHDSQCQTGYCAGHPHGGGYCTYGCDYYYGCPSGSRCLPTQYSGYYICGPYGY